ncbi:hypothetical protein ACPA9J_30610 [Pseudomonas aeruginosa]
MREVVIVDSVRTGLAKSFRGKFNPDPAGRHGRPLRRRGRWRATTSDPLAGG